MGENMWPSWPDNTAGTRLVDVKVSCSANTLFLLLWEPNSAYVDKAQQLVGNKDYSETQWDSSEQTLKAGGRGVPPASPRKPAEYKGLYRMNKCSSQGMGLKFFNEELQRCKLASDGGPFEVELTVYTTATYGERFRPIIIHRIVPLGPSACNYTVDYTLLYIQNTNSLLKRAIDRGALSGVTKNFHLLMELLGTFHPVAEMASADTDMSTLETEPAAKQVETALTSDAQTDVWNPFVSQRVTQHLSQLPFPQVLLNLQSRIGWGQNFRQRYGARLLAGVAVAVFVLILRTLLLSLETLFIKFPGLPGRLATSFFLVLKPVPSVWHIVVSLCLVWLANQQLAVLLGAVTPAAVATPLESRRPSREVRASSDGDHPRRGIKYDGFEISLEEAATRIKEGELELRKVPVPVDVSTPADNLGRTFKSSLRLLVDPTQWFGTSDSSSAVESQPAKALSPRKPEALSTSSAYLKAESKAKTAEPDLARTSKKKSEAGDRQADQAGSARNANGAGPSEDGLHRLSTHGSAAAGFRDLLSPTNLMGKTETMFQGWTAKPKPAPPMSIPAEQRRNSTHVDYEAQEEAAAARSITELADLTDIATEDTSKPIEEEVFENERIQPFRGFGHHWPGHFLPTDRVGHWSVRNSETLPPVDASRFDNVAPGLKKGWEWVEDSWQVDMSLLAEEAVDEDGWAYAVDFRGWEWPPKPGAGKFRKVRDYVRRRRWKRTRIFSGIPLQEAFASPSKPSLLRSSSSKEPSKANNQASDKATAEGKKDNLHKEPSITSSDAIPKPAVVPKQPNAAPPPRPFPPDLLNHLAAELIDPKKAGGFGPLEDRSAQSLKDAMSGALKDKPQAQKLIDRLMFMSKKEEEAKLDSAARELERANSEIGDRGSAAMKSFTDKMSSGFSSMFGAGSLSSLSFGRKEDSPGKEAHKALLGREAFSSSGERSTRGIQAQRTQSEEVDPLSAADLISHIIIKQGRDRGIQRRHSEPENIDTQPSASFQGSRSEEQAPLAVSSATDVGSAGTAVLSTADERKEDSDTREPQDEAVRPITDGVSGGGTTPIQRSDTDASPAQPPCSSHDRAEASKVAASSRKKSSLSTEGTSAAQQRDDRLSTGNRADQATQPSPLRSDKQAQETHGTSAFADQSEDTHAAPSVLLADGGPSREALPAEPRQVQGEIASEGKAKPAQPATQTNERSAAGHQKESLASSASPTKSQSTSQKSSLDTLGAEEDKNAAAGGAAKEVISAALHNLHESAKAAEASLPGSPVVPDESSQAKDKQTCSFTDTVLN